ncbi:synaptogyrin-2 [Eurytemora carolleeae]|uniref:synaptogyrin-2 n=1 Tax=Eurytemora carolleeae TaxID=1294199 RepID=UPI000C7821EB|nr:synaptogyrin-2 [Eurytemora carolleeae]|eukprot:XP_023346322.1 synaptogyrin-2-like [Eurytemora affinis]
MAHQWGSSEEPPAGYGHTNIAAAIFFSFISIFIWGVCCFLGYQRFKAGFDSAFGGGIDEEALRGDTQGGGYQAYQQGGYSEPPFNQQGEDAGGYNNVQY